MTGRTVIAFVGTFVIHIIMARAVIGAFAALIDSETPLGKEFTAGLRAIGHIFIPVAAIWPFVAARL